MIKRGFVDCQEWEFEEFRVNNMHEYVAAQDWEPMTRKELVELYEKNGNGDPVGSAGHLLKTFPDSREAFEAYKAYGFGGTWAMKAMFLIANAG